jgi:hypothetical protein
MTSAAHRQAMSGLVDQQKGKAKVCNSVNGVTTISGAFTIDQSWSRVSDQLTNEKMETRE